MNIVLCLMVLSLVIAIQCDEKSKRLLLNNDPTIIIDRLAQLEKTVQLQAAEIRSLQTQVNDSCTKGSGVAFFATLSSSFTFGNSGILRFDKVKTNAGNGYDNVTGVFIAPVNGLYHFTSVIFNNGGDDTEVQLNRNKELIVRGYSIATEHFASHTMNVVLSLQKGDHVYIQHRGGAVDTVGGYDHSSFSGFFISE